ncbi:hypothetical protein GQ55_1G083900 [Panicum hallii var. hallii]|uniref:Uncharacterized protein n=1 Tax=Panicum hallii var. hallii TaxID=1504633 RepID=A0A2T7F3L5_9POAL|nr:hypothetical protein GQ55_1G083900 [Panicum hallii var. hallii]
MAVSSLPRRPRLLALVQLAVALWLVASTGCLCQQSYPINPQPVGSYPINPQPVGSYPTAPLRPPPRRRPFPPCIGRRCTPP